MAFAAENQNLHYLFIEEYFFCQDFNSSVKSLDLSHGAGLVLVSVDGGWNVCWMSSLAGNGSAGIYIKLQIKLIFLKFWLKTDFLFPHHFGASFPFPFLMLLQVQVSQPTLTDLQSIRNPHMEVKTSEG